MRVLLDDLHPLDQRDVLKCRECRTYGEPEAVALCGWHENVVTAARIVEATFGTIVREEPDQ